MRLLNKTNRIRAGLIPPFLFLAGVERVFLSNAVSRDVLLGAHRSLMRRLKVRPDMGIEIGRFRLKQGVSEDQARAAHEKAISRFLSRQSGWHAEYMVRFEEGLYADILEAKSRERAQEICAMWIGQEDCEAFLALIEPLDMSFGSVLP